MSKRGYYLRRGDQIFEGYSWEQLCEWAAQGRIKPDDRFMTPESSTWREVEREPTLISLIPHRERLLLKRGDQTYKASGYEMIQTWAEKGQVSPDDQLYSSYTQLWTRVSELPNIMKHMPQLVLQKFEAKQSRRQTMSNLTFSRSQREHSGLTDETPLETLDEMRQLEMSTTEGLEEGEATFGREEIKTHKQCPNNLPDALRDSFGPREP